MPQQVGTVRDEERDELPIEQPTARSPSSTAVTTCLPRGHGRTSPSCSGSIVDNVGPVIQGKTEVIELVVLCLVAEGHLLIEDRPGVGKTTMAKALATSIDTTFGRIQFTPDLLPSDVVGVTVFDRGSSTSSCSGPGPVFANIVLADEINRASPKTQSALLEAMAEGQVTIDGHTHTLNRPFVVIATQNPLEHEGTYPLPDSQLDRFLMRISMGYPAREDEIAILDTHGETDGLEKLDAVVSTGPGRGDGAGGARACTWRRPSRSTWSTWPTPPGATPTSGWACPPGPRSPSSGWPGPGRRPPAAPT